MSRPLRVAHLIKGLGRGGAEALLPQTIRADDGVISYSVGYFLPWKNALEPDLRTAGARVHCFGARTSGGLLLRVPAVARWLAAERVDLVHAHLPLAGVAARIAGRLAGVPVVYSEHNLQERYHPLTRLANAATWPLQARVVAVSPQVAMSIRRHLGERRSVQVVLNGIDTRRFRSPHDPQRLRRDLALPDGAPVVGTVAVFRRQKRLDLWLRAARSILDTVPTAHFVLVGDGPLRPELEALADSLGLRPHVRFAGLREEVAEHLHLFDVFLASSQYEGLPLALLEAMAAGRAVVATAVGGVPEVVRREEGVLVPFGDPQHLATATIGLLESAAERRRLGAAARRRVEADFSVDRMARELAALYREVLGSDD